MGQQQLLLLVMGLIIVGFAVIAGFYAMETRYKQSVADHLVDRNLAIATHAVYWKTKMDPFNGGDTQYSGLAEDGLAKLALDEYTDDGHFRITSATANALEISAVSLRYPDIGVRTYVAEYEITSTDVAYDGSIVLGEE